MPSACCADTYAILRRRRWSGRSATLLACVLGLLQGCRSGELIAADPVEGMETGTALGPRNLRVTADTVVPGSRITIFGDGLQSNIGSLSATLDGVRLIARSASATSVEFEVPLGFACRAATPVQLVAQVGSARLEREVILRAAVRVELGTGGSRSMDDTGNGVCVELVTANTGASTARVVLAVVNTASLLGEPAAYALRGAGQGALAGVVSREIIPEPGALLASGTGPDVYNQSIQSEATHATFMEMQHEKASAWSSATAKWEASPRPLAQSHAPTQDGAVARATLAVGDTAQYTTVVGSCTNAPRVKARVVYTGTTAVVLEDVRAPKSGRMDATYRAIGEEYDRVMHPLLEEAVGNPLAMNSIMGAEQRVVLLFTRMVNDSMPGVSGYVSACNFYPRSTFSASNEAAVVYGRVPNAEESAHDWQRAIRGTVLHEAKHLASFAERMVRNRDFEEPWLEESTARIAEELYARTFTRGAAWRSNTGFAESVQCELMECDGRPLVMWKHFSGLHTWLRTMATTRIGQISGETGGTSSGVASNAGYASGWALVRWVLDGYVAGSEQVMLKRLVRGDAGKGLAALSVLAGVPSHVMLSDFAVGLGADAGLRIAPLASAPSSWQYGDIIGGLASMFPGVFAAKPVQMSRRTTGEFVVPVTNITGTAHFLSIEGDMSRGGQVVALKSTGSGSLRLSVRRAD